MEIDVNSTSLMICCTKKPTGFEVQLETVPQDSVGDKDTADEKSLL